MLIMTSELTHGAKAERETFDVTAPVSESDEGKKTRSFCSVSPAIRSSFSMVAGVGGAKRSSKCRDSLQALTNINP